MARKQRQALTGEDAGQWFNPSTATAWEESTRWNGNNHISNATGSQWDHETLYRTASGQWILHCSSQWQGSSDSWTIIDASEAAKWLIRCEHDLPKSLAKQGVELEV